MANKYSLKAEVFAVGRWNGIDVADADLKAIAYAFNKLGDNHRVPLKFGHNDSQKMTDGQPALGWVTDVWVEGDKLFAQFDEMPEVVFKAMEAKLYRNVSIELDMGVEHKGDYYPWVLSGVALLGADIPAVNTLAELTTYMGRDQLKFEKRMVFTTMQGVNSQRKVNMSSAEDREMIDSLNKTIEFQRTEIAKQAEKLVHLEKKIADNEAKFRVVEAAERERKSLERREALFTKLEAMVKESQITPSMREEKMREFDEAADDNGRDRVMYGVDTLKKTIEGNTHYFGAEQARRKAEQSKQEAEMDAGEVVSRRTREYMSKHGEKNFSVAKRAVMNADPELANRYVKMEG